MDKGFFCFSIIDVQLNYVFVLPKKRFVFCGYFCTFTWGFLVITRVMKMFWYFSRWFFYFLIKKSHRGMLRMSQQVTRVMLSSGQT